MLSILIPVHNYDCTTLVADLSNQCQNEGIPYEIVVMDDASTEFLETNRRIADMTGCRFLESKVNLQSARVRNRLGKQAVYENLLFLDSDLEVRDALFIHRYVEALGKAPVLVGAIVYRDEKPPVSKILRWKYGRKRECLPLAVRNQQPWKSLSSQNFLMQKWVFDEVPFDESFVRYGHEDTLLGLTLQKKGIPVFYIDNPLIHNGLESSEIFLDKSLVAAEKYVHLPVMRTPEVVQQVRIYRVCELLTKLHLDGLMAFKYRLFRNDLRKQLCGDNPSLLLFDLYRLGHLCEVNRKTKRTDPAT
jgi:glycosyltransferase involved in cell wall biosynthesis